MKGIIFDSEEHAKQADWQHNKLTGSFTKYFFRRVPLTLQSTFTKDEYAALFKIPQTIYSTDDQEIPNPRYTELDDSYTVHKYAGIVGDILDVLDEEGNVIKYASPYDRNLEFDVVEIEDDMLLTVIAEQY